MYQTQLKVGDRLVVGESVFVILGLHGPRIEIGIESVLKITKPKRPALETPPANSVDLTQVQPAQE